MHVPLTLHDFCPAGQLHEPPGPLQVWPEMVQSASVQQFAFGMQAVRRAADFLAGSRTRTRRPAHRRSDRSRCSQPTCSRSCSGCTHCWRCTPSVPSAAAGAARARAGLTTHRAVRGGAAGRVRDAAVRRGADLLSGRAAAGAARTPSRSGPSPCSRGPCSSSRSECSCSRTRCRPSARSRSRTCRPVRSKSGRSRYSRPRCNSSRSECSCSTRCRPSGPSRTRRCRPEPSRSGRSRCNRGRAAAPFAMQLFDAVQTFCPVAHSAGAAIPEQVWPPTVQSAVVQHVALGMQLLPAVQTRKLGWQAAAPARPEQVWPTTPAVGRGAARRARDAAIRCRADLLPGRATARPARSRARLPGDGAVAGCTARAVAMQLFEAVQTRCPDGQPHCPPPRARLPGDAAVAGRAAGRARDAVVGRRAHAVARLATRSSRPHPSTSDR